MGTILIVVGAAFWLRPSFDFFESEYFLLALGAIFLGAYLWRRRYGLMVPAGVLLGLGAGQILDAGRRGPIEWDQLGLGLGFLAVFLVPLAYERKSHWWPLIPASVLVLSAFDQTADIARLLFENWPIALVVGGVLLIVAGWLDRGRTRSS